MVGVDAGNSEALSYAEIECGKRPDIIEKRDGAQIGKLQYALSKTTPFFANRLRFGACTNGWPWKGMTGTANWSAMTSKIFGFDFVMGCGIIQA
jgi:hypothetical protein